MGFKWHKMRKRTWGKRQWKPERDEFIGVQDVSQIIKTGKL